jgi:hypothetical protein
MACKSVTINTKKITELAITFTVSTDGGATITSSLITEDVYNAYSEPVSTIFDECTHNKKFDGFETIVDKCKSMCIIDCLMDDDCSYPSEPQYVIGQEMSCPSEQHKIKICGLDNYSS